MGRLLRPVFGKACEECGEQIEARRVRLVPTVRRCFDCQGDVEARNRRALQGAGDNDIVILRKGL